MPAPDELRGALRSPTGRAGWPGALLLVAAGAALGWWLHALGLGGASADGEDMEEEASPVAPEEMQVRVEVAPVARGEFSIVLPAVGTVLAEPGATRSVASRAGGRVLESPVAAGQRVEAGALLVRFDPAPLALAVESARAARARAANARASYEASGRAQRTTELQAAARGIQLELDLALSNRTRLEPLLEQGLVSERAVLEARQNEDKARAELAPAEAALRAWLERGAELEGASLAAELTAAEALLADAEAVLSESEVRAPAAGQLAEWRVVVGAQLDAGTELGRLVLHAGRRLEFGVASSEAARIQEGTRVWWSDAAGTPRVGRVTGRAPEMDAETGLIRVNVTPDEAEPAEALGALVRGEIELEHRADALLVPQGAVIRADDRPAVVRVDEQGRAHRVAVRLLGRRLGLAAVEGELAAGERVVIAGGYNLPDEAHVVVGEEAPDAGDAPAPEPGAER